MKKDFKKSARTLLSRELGSLQDEIYSLRDQLTIQQEKKKSLNEENHSLKEKNEKNQSLKEENQSLKEKKQSLKSKAGKNGYANSFTKEQSEIHELQSQVLNLQSSLNDEYQSCHRARELIPKNVQMPMLLTRLFDASASQAYSKIAVMTRWSKQFIASQLATDSRKNSIVSFHRIFF